MEVKLPSSELHFPIRKYNSEQCPIKQTKHADSTKQFHYQSSVYLVVKNAHVHHDVDL